MKKSDAAPIRFLAVLQDALRHINEERSFQDERSFQGALVQELARRLERGARQDDPIIEEEYQKRLPAHGIRIRPDIIIHVPFERGLATDRHEGNFVAIELKRRASAKKASSAFESLVLMKEALRYPLTIFINVDSEHTFHELCPKIIADQTVCFAVRLENGSPVITSAGWWEASGGQTGSAR
ncbi:MAG: hypothetical protein ACYCSO_08680 [Cuniculiplasma sp.]